MSFKEIKQLRHNSQLEEALRKVTEALEQDPDNIWNKRAAAWVYYDYLKKYSNPETYDSFKENLLRLKKLELPENEKMVFDKSAWQIGSMVFALQKESEVNNNKINELFEIIKEFHFTKSSEAYSFLYKSFHKGHKNWTRYIEFADWWNFENFRPEDYLKEEFKDKKIMSIAEQAFIAYSKKLLEGEPTEESLGNAQVISREKIEAFLPKLDKVIEKHPEYQYPPYFKAKLMLALNRDDNVLSTFLPFARQKRNDFWVWGLMAEIHSDDKDTQFACYCKALSLNTPEEFLVKMRQSFAALLIDRQMYNEAKTEIEKVLDTRAKQQWKTPKQIKQWTDQDWYKSAYPNNNNKELYTKHKGKAEAILYQDIPEKIIAVEFVNYDKKMIHFVINSQESGFFKYEGLLNNTPQVGDLYKVRLEEVDKNGFHRARTIKPAKSGQESEAIRTIEDSIYIPEGKDFGFVQDAFVIPKLITDNKLKTKQKVIAKAILSYNKKKEEWGWKAFNIKPLTP